MFTLEHWVAAGIFYVSLYVTYRAVKKVWQFVSSHTFEINEKYKPNKK